MTDQNTPQPEERPAPPPPEQRPAHDTQIEEHGVDLLSIAAGAGIYKAVDMGIDYVSGKIADARRPPEPPPTDSGPKVILPPGANRE